MNKVMTMAPCEIKSGIAAAALVLLMLPITISAQGTQKKLYCWDQDNRRICADTLPIKAVDLAHIELNASSGSTYRHARACGCGY